MNFYWVPDIVRLGHYIVYWEIGKNDLADYFTKHHPPYHLFVMRLVYLHFPGNANN